MSAWIYGFAWLFLMGLVLVASGLLACTAAHSDQLMRAAERCRERGEL
ncbi:MAG: hypothetical protein HOQ05_12930 [Corynebacteriales bacterium]|nr:hypothetical protein [Mycobacteriales bacterium]